MEVGGVHKKLGLQQGNSCMSGPLASCGVFSRITDLLLEIHLIVNAIADLCMRKLFFIAGQIGL